MSLDFPVAAVDAVPVALGVGGGARGRGGGGPVGDEGQGGHDPVDVAGLDHHEVHQAEVGRDAEGQHQVEDGGFHPGNEHSLLETNSKRNKVFFSLQSSNKTPACKPS